MNLLIITGLSPTVRNNLVTPAARFFGSGGALRVFRNKEKTFVPVVRGKINELLRTARIEGSFSQLVASKELGLGNSQYVSNIERGLCAPSMDTVLVLAKLYKIAPHKIVDIMLTDYSGALSERVFQRKIAR